MSLHNAAESRFTAFCCSEDVGASRNPIMDLRSGPGSPVKALSDAHCLQPNSRSIILIILLVFSQLVELAAPFPSHAELPGFESTHLGMLRCGRLHQHRCAGQSCVNIKQHPQSKYILLTTILADDAQLHSSHQKINRVRTCNFAAVYLRF